jgi:hypothetical protein
MSHPLPPKHFSNPCYVALTATFKKHLKIQRIGSVISIHYKPFLNAIFLASTFFLSKEPYAFLSHFKSKGISVFLTPPKGQSLQKNLHPLGSIFFQNLVSLNTNLLCS